MPPRRTGIVVAALAIAALAVVGVLTWLTGSWPTSDNPEATPAPITVDVVTPNPDAARITQEAAMSEPAPESSPAVAGVTAMAETGPTDNVVAVTILFTFIGLSGSAWIARYA